MRAAAERLSPMQRAMACRTTLKIDLIRGSLELTRYYGHFGYKDRTKWRSTNSETTRNLKALPFQRSRNLNESSFAIHTTTLHALRYSLWRSTPFQD